LGQLGLPLRLRARLLALFGLLSGSVLVISQGAAEGSFDLRLMGLRALILGGFIWFTFHVATSVFARQNKVLREHAITRDALTADLARRDGRLGALLQNSADGIVAIRADGTISYESDTIERMLGYKATDRLGHQVLEYIHPDDLPGIQSMLDQIKTTPGARVVREYRVQHADGSWHFMEAIVQNLLDDPAVEAIVINFRDVTERRALQAEVTHLAFQFRSLMENTEDSIYFKDRECRLVHASRRMANNLGFSDPSELVGKTDIDLFGEAFGRQTRAEELQIMASNEPIIGMVENRPIGDREANWTLTTKVPLHDEAGETVGLLGITREINELKQTELDLAQMAFHDILTGLPNRTLFSDRLSHALARTTRSASRLAVMFIDLDDFKTVNDTLGHDAGDALLVAVAQRLRAALRPSDTIARMGGDEFAVLLEDQQNEHDPIEAAERLRIALSSTPFNIAGQELFVHASIGVTVSSPRTANIAELLKEADLAMYTSKTRGKGRSEVFDPSMQDVVNARLALKADLERALERGEFELLYQPIFSLANRTIEGVEGLIRWHHPSRGLVAPVDFIPLAEETGLMVSIARWCLDQACGQMIAWDAAGMRPIKMSMNISARQILLGQELVDDVATTLARHGLAPERLTLELTESMLMQDTEDIATTVASLKALGIDLALDDFGTGYSSLSYLSRFPFDVLKIDRAFVAGLGTGPDKEELVRSIVNLARSMNLRTVAEGIETEAQLAILARFGANSGQGWLFAKALTPDALLDMVRREIRYERQTARSKSSVA
jgi:diguanylate cyclase (GGDEF)-like protein/PAS domain S-box-containing protein